MSRSRIVYRPRSDATAKGELDAIAAVYKFVLERKKAAYDGGPENARLSVELDDSNEKGSRAAKPGTPNKCTGRIPGDAT